MKKFLQRKVPFIYDDKFITFDAKPVKTKDYIAVSNSVKHAQTLAIVMQGPVSYENNFTLETIKLYKKNFINCQIIVSTWDYENNETLKLIENEGCVVLRNKDPQLKDWANINRQIYSSFAGIKKAKDLGFTYVIKTRTDQRLYETNIAEYLFNLLEVFPLDSGASKNQLKRLVSLSFNTFKYRLYDVSDMFLFGHVDDVLKFWSCGFETRDKLPSCKSLKEFAQLRPSEIYYTTEYLKKLGHNIKWTLEDSWRCYAKYFCIVDAGSVGLYWPKYSNLSNRWRNFYGEHPDLEELTFKEWVLLYKSLDNICVPEEYIERQSSGNILKFTLSQKVIKFFINFLPSKKSRRQAREKYLYNK
ncbi:WavE lipopolysaccharide synthesis family protein [Endomicrobium proavitum]|uniref:WavE lipopolysaccharide synthesis n=1 Tax=Endomicrobium proavitum TaxID=1408281 RepID=A0A0G3WL68_9BACT|nr:WavE lipopolysaccharide synthesis family protein [Endomicrobium proavitum]AKL98630.1 hypothetical protein Epro_1251 [Endomicrobium proavitum]